MTAFTATKELTRLALRRDRIQLPVWIYGTAALTYSTTASVDKTYETVSERAHAVKLLTDSPALLMMRGTPAGSSTGSVAMAQILTYLLVIAALMSTLTVVRHTRQNEETGRSEIVGAAVVGRHAGLAAAMIVAIEANIGLLLLVSIVLLITGLPAGGAFLIGAVVAGVGLVFAGIAAVAAQVSQTSRGANGISAAAIGAAFLLRGVGDALGDVKAKGTEVVSAWPSWLSPLGWAQQAHAFGDQRWWLLAPLVAVAAAGFAAAFAMSARRDVGSGMIAARPGPVDAQPTLLSPWGLAWRLQRGSLLGWAVGLAVLGATIGSIGKEAADALKDNHDLADTLGKLGGGSGDLVDTFFSSMMLMVGAATAGYAVQALLRLRAEEASGRVELFLSTAVSRYRWMASHIACAVAGAVGLLLVAGLSAGLAYGAATGDMGDGFGKLTGAALIQVPAVLVLAGLVVAVFAVLPRRVIPLGWAALALCLVLGQLGELLKLSQAVRDASPFSHLPQAPGGEVTVLPLAALLAVAVALTWVGMAHVRRRDLTA